MIKGYIDKIVTDNELQTDIKDLIPNGCLRRRMSSIVRKGVATAIKCMREMEDCNEPDAIITATGFGCLSDSERFLRNIINDKEQFLNPTPFIQSTFNTVGGQIGLIRQNSCYNMTYVNRSHSFEDALLDALFQLSDGDAESVLVGAFDEKTVSQEKIMSRMGLFKDIRCGEGCVFMHMTSSPTRYSLAQISKLDFLTRSLTKNECLEKYSTCSSSIVVYNGFKDYGIYPTVSAKCLVRAISMVCEGEEEVIVYNEYLGSHPTVIVVRCIG